MFEEFGERSSHGYLYHQPEHFTSCQKGTDVPINQYILTKERKLTLSSLFDERKQNHGALRLSKIENPPEIARLVDQHKSRSGSMENFAAAMRLREFLDEPALD